MIIIWFAAMGRTLAPKPAVTDAVLTTPATMNVVVEAELSCPAVPVTNKGWTFDVVETTLPTRFVPEVAIQHHCVVTEVEAGNEAPLP